MNERRIPEVVIRRLPKYLRRLQELEEEGVLRVSSLQLSHQMGLNASQIRQDLNLFGGFGQQGYGYLVTNLKESIADILGLEQGKKMIIIGAGNMGISLASYKGFIKKGFNIVKMFDVNPNIIGKSYRGIEVLAMEKLKDYCMENAIDVGIITTPKEHAQGVADILMEAKVKGIWNFSPADINAKDIIVEDVRLSDSLYVLNYKMNNNYID